MRYPGGKTKQIKVLAPLTIELLDNKSRYVEPFVGGGSVATAIAKQSQAKQFWINEFSYPMYCYWKSVINYPDLLIQQIENYVPKVNDFYEWKELFRENDLDILLNLPVWEVGFKKLAIHQISYSGLGEMAGSPIGGRNQLSKYDVGCRWNPARLIKDIKFWNTSEHKVDVTWMDFADVITQCNENDAIYLDPPYWEKGSQLYTHSFGKNQHLLLGKLLTETPASWVLSYDPNPVVDYLATLPNVESYNIEQINSIEGKRTQNRVLSESLLIKR